MRRTGIRLVMMLLVLLNAVHPIFHRFEGGSVDGMLDYIDMWVMSMQSHWTSL